MYQYLSVSYSFLIWKRLIFLFPTVIRDLDTISSQWKRLLRHLQLHCIQWLQLEYPSHHMLKSAIQLSGQLQFLEVFPLVRLKFIMDMAVSLECLIIQKQTYHLGPPYFAHSSSP